MNKANVFRQCNYIESELFENTADPLHRLRCAVLENLKEYLKTGSYTNYKSKRIFLETTFSGVGYMRLDSVLAKRLNIKQASVRLLRKRLSAKALSLLGGNLVERILRGDSIVLNRLVRDLEVLNKGIPKPSEIFPADLLEICERCSFSGDNFALDECIKEIQLLNYFCLNNIGGFLLHHADIEKMRYLLDILGSPTNPDHKTVLRAVTRELLYGFPQLIKRPEQN